MVKVEKVAFKGYIVGMEIGSPEHTYTNYTRVPRYIIFFIFYFVMLYFVA